MVNKNIFLIIIPGIVTTLIVLNFYGYLLLEEHGECSISKQQYSLTGKVIVGGMTIQSPLNESQCIESCQRQGSDSPVVAKCSFKGVAGTNWSKTSDDFEEFDEYGVK